VDEGDKEKAEEKSKVLHKKAVSVIPVSSTVDIDFKNLKPIEERFPNFISFGIIRKYKGIENYTIPIAKEFAKRGDKRKVILCGSVPRGKDADPSLLSEILIAAYPKSEREVLSIMESVGNDKSTSVEQMMALYQNVLKKEESSNNLELQFDVPETKLYHIFNRARYAFNFNFKGVSPHFSGVTNTFMAGMKNYGLNIYMTDHYLKPEGKYADIAGVFNEDEPIESVAATILEDVESLEKVGVHSKVGKQIENFIAERKFSKEAVIDAYKKIYLEDGK
jgi:hypothetical protein